jgi:predicted nicotinamide N-methyase
MEELGPEDIFSSSLEMLYDYQPITLASAGSVYRYTSNLQSIGSKSPINITLHTPNTLPANWSLHASDIWASSIYLADHIDQVNLDALITLIGVHTPEKVHVLELGAAAGLPGILIAKLYGDAALVTVSDYPDEQLIRTLSNNVARNGVSRSCHTIPYAWGSDSSCLLREDISFDVIIAADTLWNPDLHSLFITSLQTTLKRSPMARVHLVAGLHTGRYTLQSFMSAARKAGFEVETALEKEVMGPRERLWNVEGEGNEDEKERRRWVVWMVLRWNVLELQVRDH